MTAVTPSQTPRGTRIYLDHVGWFVRDMDQASVAFHRLGLPMTPLTVHHNALPDGTRVRSGTANRCAMIHRGYLEVLVRLEDIDSPLTREMKASCSRYEGLHLIAFSVADTEAAATRLQAAGFDPAPPVALRRPVALDDDGEAEAQFSVLRLASNPMPEGRVQILSHESPDAIWQPSVTASRNALQALSGVMIVTAAVDETAARYARFTGCAARPVGQNFRISLDRGEIVICTAESCETVLPGIHVPDLPFMAAVAIESGDIAATRFFLAEAGVPLLGDLPDRIIVHPDAGAGAAFVLHAPETDPFALP